MLDIWDIRPFRQELCNFVNLLLNGDTPESVNTIIYGGRLLALDKKDGGISQKVTRGDGWQLNERTVMLFQN